MTPFVFSRKYTPLLWEDRTLYGNFERRIIMKKYFKACGEAAKSWFKGCGEGLLDTLKWFIPVTLIVILVGGALLLKAEQSDSETNGD